jgi:carboxylate-amine ligase
VPEAPLTMGVEEEFLLADVTTGRTVARAAAVLEQAARVPPAAPDAATHRELRATQVEAATGKCTTLVELQRQLAYGRRQLSDAARDVEADLIAAGTPVLVGELGTEPVDARYAQIDAIYQGLTATYQACGCHVHIGVADRALAVAVINRLRPWLPTLLALSGNSPIHDAWDTGYASWRMIEQRRFPGGGVPPSFASAGAYDDEVARLTECGVTVEGMSFWLVRLSPRLPTIEFRVADAASTVQEAVLQAALARAMVSVAREEVLSGCDVSPFSDQVGAAAVWSAARYGLRGSAVHPVHQVRVPAMVVLHELVERVTPALMRTGDLDAVLSAIACLVREGTGAELQRRAAAGSGPREVIRMLAGRTAGARHSQE